MRFAALFTAAVLTAFAAGLPAHAAPAPAAKAEPYSKEQLAKGAKGAPDVVRAAAIPCELSDAALVNEGMGKNPDDPKGAELKVASYEIACKGSMGYILQNYAGLPTKIYDCVSLSESPSPCRLPENRDPKVLVQSVVAAAGKTCTVTGERPLGATKAGDRFYEVACSEGPGYILKAGAPTSSTPPVAQGCAQALGTNVECKLTSREQITQALNGTVGNLLAHSGKTCQVTGSREVGSDSSGTTYYEASCGGGTGFMVAAKNGQFVRAIDCANARGIGGGCTLTDVTKAETAEAGTYSKLAAAAGYPCQVAQYRYVGVDTKTNSEVVELKCANRPDGRIALFPTDNKGGARFYDCIAAGAIGETCKLNDANASLPDYTKALASKGKTSCKVSNAKWLGVNAEGVSYVETACSDGLPGWVVARTPTGQVSELLSCGQAKSVGVACSLPGNNK